METENNGTERQTRRRPTKALPTERMVVSKQLDILRGYVAASGPERKPVSNDEVASVVGVHTGTVSICNPFFASVGLIRREKNGHVPSDDVYSYADRFKWEQEKSTIKLAPAFRAAWFSAVLLPKLSYRALTKDECVSYLAEESSAEPGYKISLERIIEYLAVVGIVRVEGNSVTASPEDQQYQAATTSTPVLPTEQPQRPQVEEVPHPLAHVHPSIIGVLLKLPKVEDGWSAKDKKKFMAALGPVLDLVYNVEESE